MKTGELGARCFDFVPDLPDQTQRLSHLFCGVFVVKGKLPDESVVTTRDRICLSTSSWNAVTNLIEGRSIGYRCSNLFDLLGRHWMPCWCCVVAWCASNVPRIIVRHDRAVQNSSNLHQMRYTPLLCLLLSGCSSIWADTSAPLPVAQPVEAPSQETIQKGVKAAMREAKLVAPIEVSAVRTTDHGPGRYFVCMREAIPSPNGPRIPYAVFFENGYVGLRQSVIMESCEQQQYSWVN